MYRRTHVDATHFISMAPRVEVWAFLLAVIMGFEPTTSKIKTLLPYRLAISHFIQFIIVEFIKYKTPIYFS